MIVVSDTTPLRYLIEEITILESLFGEGSYRSIQNCGCNPKDYFSPSPEEIIQGIFERERKRKQAIDEGLRHP